MCIVHIYKQRLREGGDQTIEMHCLYGVNKCFSFGFEYANKFWKHIFKIPFSFEFESKLTWKKVTMEIPYFKEGKSWNWCDGCSFSIFMTALVFTVFNTQVIRSIPFTTTP